MYEAGDLKYLVIKATADHVEGIVTLVNSAYRGESSRQGWTTEADLLGGQRTDVEAVRSMLANPEATFLIGCLDGVGDIISTVYLEKVGEKCYLGMLTVKPILQQRGIAKVLVKESEDFALRSGCRCLKMSVIYCRSELIAYYRRLGFQSSGETEPFPYGDERFGLPKVEGLFFEIYEKQLR
uniref:N-acetyltransferase domain-containing protein n=1 Tax=Cyanoptyche gloeocystis TaxID=77922 RepID=A0A7S2NQQ6_9EUKA|mmetsp:Transcript_41/g.100  ORF Transcript_41/g.100 Transcript_41/m.100 type:complete len:182 (+) Transcript_41:30-575(+)